MVINFISKVSPILFLGMILFVITVGIIGRKFKIPVIIKTLMEYVGN
jgi:hypothetical protein